MIASKAWVGRFTGLAVVAALSGCTTSVSAAPLRPGQPVSVVAAENEYGSVAAQIGAPYVLVTSVMDDPNTDPHSFELSSAVARDISTARIVIQNGLGYDSFMNSIETAATNRQRTVIDVGRLLHRPDGTPNPHLWYDPMTMPAVAAALAATLARLEPDRASYFYGRAAAFKGSLGGWTSALDALRTRFPGAPVATTEPVADYLLTAGGLDNRTPFSFQADVMNGVDPAPQDITVETDLLRHHGVRVLVYNQQVTDTFTASFVRMAQKAGIPVVGVYETMPQPGYDYQSWMQAETDALVSALATGSGKAHL